MTPEDWSEGVNRGESGGRDDAGDDAGDDDIDDLVSGLLDGEHRALARAITKIENRVPGYRDLVARLHAHAGSAAIVGVTGSPGAGKSTLVDKLATAYRDRGETVGVVAVDPASPFTGGAVLGDRIRMASNAGDMDVFFRSMSARGTLGGLSSATADAVTALDAFGKDRIVVETVGAGQNEIDVVRTTDTVVVLVPPESGDDVQMLKAGILEIADVFVVNKADLEGADRTVRELREMLHHRDAPGTVGAVRSAGPGTDDGRDEDGASDRRADDGAGDGQAAEGPDGRRADDGASDGSGEGWTPPVLTTVASTGEGVEGVLDALDDHRAYLDRSGQLRARRRDRYAEEIRTLVREHVTALLAEEIDASGGLESFGDAVAARETDPYSVADEFVAPVAACLRERRSESGRDPDAGGGPGHDPSEPDSDSG